MKITKLLLTTLVLAFLALPFLFTNSCRHDPIGIDQLDTVCFQTQILPMLKTSCGICHGPGKEGGFDPNSYSGIMRIVKSGDAANSKLYEVITNSGGEGMMPPNRPLNKDQRTLILVWIEQGAQNTTCDTTGGGGGPQYNMDTICFTQNIAPIFQSNCGKTGCHDVTSHKEGYVLTNYNTIMQNGEGIIPYYPNSSKLYQITSSSAGEDIMPPAPNPALTAAQRELLRQWIADGALNSNCPWTTCDTTGTLTYTANIAPLIQVNCIGCHNATNASGSVDLSSYTQVKYYSETLRSGTPIILGATKHISGFVPMPPSGILSTCQIRTIELWISQGMVNTK